MTSPQLEASEAAFLTYSAILVQAVQGMNRIEAGVEQRQEIVARILQTVDTMEAKFQRPESLEFSQALDLKFRVMRMILGIALHAAPQATFDDVTQELGDLTKLLTPKEPPPT